MVLVRNEAIGVNFIDTYFRTGLYPAGLPNSLGVEGAGVVEEVGPNTAHPQGLKRGDRVAYISPGPRSPQSCSYAEFSAVPADSVVKLPGGVTCYQGAATILQGLTALSMAETCAGVQPGDWVLIHAAAGGTGQLLAQVCRQLGARVIGTTSTEAKAAVAREAGCEAVLLYSKPGVDIPLEVSRLTGGQGCRVVFDGVGAATFDLSLNCLGYLGWLLSFGNASGKVPPVDLLKLSDKGVRLMRPSLFTTLKSKEGLFMELATRLMDGVAAGKIKQQIYRVYPLEAAGDAHRALEGRATTGKVLLRPGS